LLALDDIAEIGNALVVPPPAVENEPAPNKPPDVKFVEPIIPKAMFA